MPEQTYAPRSYEELLTGRIGKLYEAKEEGNDYLFDEVIDEIVGLLKLNPSTHQTFINKQNGLSNLANQALTDLETQIATIEDEIIKELTKAQKTAIIKWEYRNDLLDVILDIMNEYQLIPFITPVSADAGMGELTPEHNVAEFEPIEQPISKPPIQQPQPTQPVQPTQHMPQKTPPQQSAAPIPPPAELVDKKEIQQSNKVKIKPPSNE